MFGEIDVVRIYMKRSFRENVPSQIKFGTEEKARLFRLLFNALNPKNREKVSTPLLRHSKE